MFEKFKAAVSAAWSVPFIKYAVFAMLALAAGTAVYRGVMGLPLVG